MSLSIDALRALGAVPLEEWLRDPASHFRSLSTLPTGLPTPGGPGSGALAESSSSGAKRKGVPSGNASGSQSQQPSKKRKNKSGATQS
jgi:hypothetical protein